MSTSPQPKMNIPFSPPDITQAEIDQVVEALQSGWITTGPKTKELERLIAELCQTPQAVTFSSNTTGMENVLRFMGLRHKDEVLTCAYTYTASASVAAHVGARPVLIDTQDGGFEMDYEALERAITPQTKAIIPVDLGGRCIDYSKLFAAIKAGVERAGFNPANERQEALGRPLVLGDTAHSFGGSQNGVMAGNIADISSFSFHAVKNFTTAEGGAITWRDDFLSGLMSHDEIYRQLMLWQLHGQSKDALAKTKPGAWEYDIEILGYKCNMPDIAAALGVAQMPRYAKMLDRRRTIIERYNEAFADDERFAYLNHYDEHNISSGHLYLLRLLKTDEAGRNKFIEQMAGAGISTNVHYKPLPCFTAYKKLGYRIEDYPNAFNQYQNEVTLPLYSLLTDDQIDYIIEQTLALAPR